MPIRHEVLGGFSEKGEGLNKVYTTDIMSNQAIFEFNIQTMRSLKSEISIMKTFNPTGLNLVFFLKNFYA